MRVGEIRMKTHLSRPTVSHHLKILKESQIAQVILRWHLQCGIMVIPKSTNPQRIKENIEIFDFELNEEDMDHIRRLDTGKRYSISPNGYMINPIYINLMKLFIR
ncbi:aldo/keto reductase [Paenibacillus sp. FSL L8-0435]|uniref:aldo/keto reductase n=1 Tax=Paenibacillus sp. FSL L8-0435 TaxID=2954618 RepID=UPI0030D8F969